MQLAGHVLKGVLNLPRNTLISDRTFVVRAVIHEGGSQSMECYLRQAANATCLFAKTHRPRVYSFINCTLELRRSVLFVYLGLSFGTSSGDSLHAVIGAHKTDDFRQRLTRFGPTKQIKFSGISGRKAIVYCCVTKQCNLLPLLFCEFLPIFRLPNTIFFIHFSVYNSFLPICWVADNWFFIVE